MDAILNSLMSGGYTPDVDCDLISEQELLTEEKEIEAQKMSLEELYAARLEAVMSNDMWTEAILNDEIERRAPVVKLSGYGTLQDEPYCYNPDEEDRRKEWLENYAAEDAGFEPDELPF